MTRRRILRLGQRKGGRVNLRRFLVAIAAATVGVLALVGNGSAAALPTATDCVRSPDVIVNATAAGRQVTAIFDIKPGCVTTPVTVTLAAYSKASAGYVFPQTLAATATGQFASPGQGYMLTFLLPSCGFDQLD